MNTQNPGDKTLEQMPADRSLVNRLYRNGLISPRARREALDLLYPRTGWAWWIMVTLYAIGTSLFLTGAVFFFAFNWEKIPDWSKLAGVQAGIVLCLVGAYVWRPRNLKGKFSLLGASVLVGVFLAVFGQIYQTGADPYELFGYWSLLTFGWVLISEFAAHWILWLAVTNTFLVLWWYQAVVPSPSSIYFLYVILTVFNGLANFLQFVGSRNRDWLDQFWTKLVLRAALLLPATIPIVALSSLETSSPSLPSLLAGTVAGGLAIASLVVLDRYFTRSLPCLSMTGLSICIILETILINQLSNLFGNADDFALYYLLTGVGSLLIFSGMVLLLKNTRNILVEDS